MTTEKEKRPDTTPASIENKRSKNFYLTQLNSLHTVYSVQHSQQRNQNNRFRFGGLSPVLVTVVNGHISFTNLYILGILFLEEYLIMIVVYADESGTHDPKGVEDGSSYPIIAGFAAKKSVWDTFCVNWNGVLKSYDVPYFHGRELRAAEAAIIHKKEETNELKKNPYYAKKWDIKKINSFKLSLTKIISSGDKIPIAGAMSIPIFNENLELQKDKDPYRYCMRQFFAVYYKETQLQWGNFKSEVSFVFDQNDKKEWRNSVHEIFGEFQKIDTRISGPTFADKKTFRHFPLQAADLFAYRARQHMEDHANNELEITPLDKILLRNLLKSAAIKYPHIAHLLK